MTLVTNYTHNLGFQSWRSSCAPCTRMGTKVVQVFLVNKNRGQTLPFKCLRTAVRPSQPHVSPHACDYNKPMRGCANCATLYPLYSLCARCAPLCPHATACAPSHLHMHLMQIMKPLYPMHPMQVCGGLALGLLHPQELELLSAGLPHLDFAALEAGTRVRVG